TRLGVGGKPGVGGLNTWGYHAVNLAIHIIAALALFGLVRRTLRLPQYNGRFDAAAEWIALSAALFWMLHPIQTQAVTYIVQRFESMMGMFFLLSFYAMVRGGTAKGTPAAVAWYALTVFLCFCSMLCKEVAIVLPILLVLYDVVFLSPSGVEGL